jgi:hypothetical protein
LDAGMHQHDVVEERRKLKIRHTGARALWVLVPLGRSQYPIIKVSPFGRTFSLTGFGALLRSLGMTSNDWINEGKYFYVWRFIIVPVRNFYIPISLLIILSTFSLMVRAVDEDSATLSERGILNFIHYQKVRLSDYVYTVDIGEDGIAPTNLDVILANRGVHGTLIVENKDEAVHRIVFSQHIGNNLSNDMKSPVIKPGERWALDIMKDGIYPFQCTLHPEKSQGMLQVWYEEEEF